MFDDITDLISRIIVYVSSATAAFLAFVETHYNSIGLVITAIGVFGGLALNFWHKRRIQRLRELEIFGKDGG